MKLNKTIGIILIILAALNILGFGYGFLSFLVPYLLLVLGIILVIK